MVTVTQPVSEDQHFRVGSLALGPAYVTQLCPASSLSLYSLCILQITVQSHWIPHPPCFPPELPHPVLLPRFLSCTGAPSSPGSLPQVLLHVHLCGLITVGLKSGYVCWSPLLSSPGGAFCYPQPRLHSVRHGQVRSTLMRTSWGAGEDAALGPRHFCKDSSRL